MSTTHFKKSTLAVLTLFFSMFTLSGLAQDTVQTRSLKEVAVTASKPLIKHKPGKIIYDLQADPDSKGQNLLTMMRKVPFISIDGNENIMLKGNANFKVLLNGKPSGLVEYNLKDLLKSMPASTIQSIEVITTPSARYDLEGIAGIINIITIKKTDNGYNGTVSLSERFPAAGPGLGSSLTVKHHKFGLSLFNGGSISNNPATQSMDTRTTTGTNPAVLVQSGNHSARSKTGYLGTELSYELDSLHLISAQFNLRGDQSKNTGKLFSQLTGTPETSNSYRFDQASQNDGNGYDASFNYQHGFKENKTKLLTFSYRYSSNENTRNNQTGLSELINIKMPSYQQYNEDRSTEQTMQIDYVYPAKNLNIGAGIKGILRNSKSDYQYLSFNTADQLYEPDPAFSNFFNYKQNVFSAYNTYEFNLKSWGFNAGIRFEKTFIDADFLSDHSLVSQNYLNVVPNFAVNKSFKNGNSLSFGFTQRIKRPGINRLNPFIDRSNPAFETTGNPNLQPVLVNSFQAGYTISKKVTVNISADYSFINNADLRVSTFNPATNITYTTYENSGRIKGLGAYLYLNYPVSERLNLSLNGNMLYFWIEGIVNGQSDGQKLLAYYANLSTGYNFDKGWRLNADISFISKNPTGFQGTTNGFISSSVGISKELIKNKLSFAANVYNPFNKYRNNETITSAPDFIQVTTVQNYFRAFNASLNYKFGRLKSGLKKNKKEIRNDDLSNKKSGF